MRKKYSSFKNFRQDNNLTLEQVAVILGITKQSIWNAEKKNKIPFKHLQKLSEIYDCEFVDEKYFINKTDDDCINIAVRGDVSASMGFGVTVYDETKTGAYQISKKLANDLGIIPEKSEMIFASGDSMLPTIEGGDSLLIDLNRKEIYDGRIYCVRIDGQLYAKRLQKIPPSKVIVISDNQKYQSFEIDFSKQIEFDFEVIGEIRWWGRVAR